MAFEIIGEVYMIGAPETIQKKNGGTFLRRQLVLKQRRIDPNTYVEYEPNFPSFDFKDKGCELLDRFKLGDRVKVVFDISGTKYADRQSNGERYFNSLRAFKIDLFVMPQQQQQQVQPMMQQAPPPQYPQQGYPQQGYQQQGYQQGYQPQPQQPFPQQGIDPQTGLPF
ncbi:MAG: DUF3127 domain-containing protein [Bacteroidaceae bacterium]|nr:DUF3127 domain-containing protein [Bacteroidaceae bacterium]